MALHLSILGSAQVCCPAAKAITLHKTQQHFDATIHAENLTNTYMQQFMSFSRVDVKFFGSTRLTRCGCTLFRCFSNIWGSCCFPPLKSLDAPLTKGPAYGGDPGFGKQLQSPNFAEFGLVVSRWPSCHPIFSHMRKVTIQCDKRTVI
jgi:hypothetical protein